MHGIDQEGKNVSITVKNEYVPEAGSQKIDDEELLWNWITGTLKGSAEHLNMHIFPQNGNCLQIKRSDSKRVFSNFSTKLKQTFVFFLNNLNKIFNLVFFHESNAFVHLLIS